MATDLKNAGANIWLDQLDIAAGSRWDDAVEAELKASNGIIISLSPVSVKSQNVMDEVSFAINQGKKIVPLIIENCDVPFRLARFQHIDFTGNYDTALQKLLESLHAEVEQGSTIVTDTFKEPISADKWNFKKKLLPSFILIGMLVLVLAIVFMLLNKRAVNVPLVTTSTTVFVHGKESKQNMILRQKGHVIMDLGGERKKAQINENGQAFFQNLHIGDSVRLEIDFSEPYKTLYPDSVYLIQSNGNVYLPVMLQGIDKVKGMVLYNDAPLTGVIVKLVGKTGYLLDTTNQTGDFDFNIPEPMQTNQYETWFMKEGFKTRFAPSFPQTGDPLNIVLEKK